VRREARPSQCDTKVVRLNLLPSGGGLGRGKMMLIAVLDQVEILSISSLTLRDSREGPTDLTDSPTLRFAWKVNSV